MEDDLSGSSTPLGFNSLLCGMVYIISHTSDGSLSASRPAVLTNFPNSRRNLPRLATRPDMRTERAVSKHEEKKKKKKRKRKTPNHAPQTPQPKKQKTKKQKTKMKTNHKKPSHTSTPITPPTTSPANPLTTSLDPPASTPTTSPSSSPGASRLSNWLRTM